MEKETTPGSAASSPPLSFKKVAQEDRVTDAILRPPSTFFKDSMYSLLRNPLGMFGASVIIFMIL